MSNWQDQDRAAPAGRGWVDVAGGHGRARRDGALEIDGVAERAEGEVPERNEHPERALVEDRPGELPLMGEDGRAFLRRVANPSAGALVSHGLKKDGVLAKPELAVAQVAQMVGPEALDSVPELDGFGRSVPTVDDELAIRPSGPVVEARTEEVVVGGEIGFAGTGIRSLGG